jgi:predicted DNA-binding protein (MmcQ/YjbR family)
VKALPPPISGALAKRVAAVRAALDAQPGAVGSPLPSARGVTLYKVMGKGFAILEVNKFAGIIVKCDPQLVEILKEQYAGVGHRSHLDRRFWIAVNFDADVPVKEIRKLVAQSYALVCAGLTRKQKAELETLGVKRAS